MAGNDVAIVLEERDGHIFYDPIPPDMIVTAHSTPQVRVTINDIHSKYVHAYLLHVSHFVHMLQGVRVVQLVKYKSLIPMARIQVSAQPL